MEPIELIKSNKANKINQKVVLMRQFFLFGSIYFEETKTPSTFILIACV